MDKLVYLFLFLLIFLSSLNKKLMYLVLCVYTILCIFYNKNIELVFVLLLIYLVSISQYEGFETTTSSTNETISNTDQSLENTNKVSENTNKISENSEVFNIKSSDYSELFFVLKSLLKPSYFKKNRENIDLIIENYRINTIYELSDKILNIKQNSLYNNFLEKITCIKNGKTDYLDCDNINYKKLYGFSELIKVYSLSVQKVIELINKHKIYKLCDLSAKRYILNSHSEYGYELNGLLFYLNEKSINDKYYKIITLLELDNLLNNKTINIRESLYNYNDKNTQVVKDLNSIIVLFDYYKIVDELKMNNEEDDFNWDYSILRNIDLNRLYWENNPYFKKYDIKNKIIEKINELTKDDKNIFKHQLNKKFDKKPPINNTKEESYKVIKNENNENPGKSGKSGKSGNFLEKMNLNMIKENFVKTFISIIDDISELYTNRCSVDCENSKNIVFSQFMYYFSNILKIVVKNGRMFYIGIFIIFLSIMLFFIEVTK